MQMNKKYVYYEDFGAVGDGVTDDWEAIRDAHNYANEHRAQGYAIKAKEGATYLIRGITAPTFIMTDCVWTGAKFIVDDRGITKGDARDTRFFHIAPEYPKRRADAEEIAEIFDGVKIKRGAFTSVKWKYGYPATIIPVNSEVRHFIRIGRTTATAGGSQTELFDVDSSGKVSENTPVMFDYDQVTDLYVVRNDDPAITIDGGEFITIASDVPQTQSYYISRGIGLKRSNTTVKNLKHYVEGELDWDMDTAKPRGCSYSGFLFCEDCRNVLIENCVFTGHRYYKFSGTYDIRACLVSNITYKNCIQSNFYNSDGTPAMLDNRQWGIIGTSYCKNMTFDGCMLSRFDAHSGVYNAKILNSKIQTVEIIGGGEMLIENTKFIPTHYNLVMLRTDYGSHFDGSLTIRNCTVDDSVRPIKNVLSTTWVNHFFGYECRMPDILIDNLKFETPKEKLLLHLLYNNQKPEENVSSPVFADGEKNENPYRMPKRIEVINNESGTLYYLNENSGVYENTLTDGLEISNL